MICMYVVQPYHKDPTLQGKHMRKSRVMQVLYGKHDLQYCRSCRSYKSTNHGTVTAVESSPKYLDHDDHEMGV